MAASTSISLSAHLLRGPLLHSRILGQSLPKCPRCHQPCYSLWSPQTQTRGFAQSIRTQNTAKRLLMTETAAGTSAEAYRPEALAVRQGKGREIPPRNVGVAESSIAGGLDKDKTAVRWKAHAAAAPSSLPRGGPPEATTSPHQASSPPASQTDTAPLSKAKPTRPASRLRARKAAMTLSPTAVSHIRSLLASPEPKLIRVGVKNKGCSGSAYHLEYVDRPGKFDELVEQDGVRVLVDSKALIKVIGSEMDWIEDKLSARFVFKNPNIKEQCGCGESFSVG